MIISQTPLRVSFVGGGTDLPSYYQNFGGSVLSTSIDKFIYVIVKSRYDDSIILNYSKKETVKSVENIQHDIIRETMKKVGVYKGVEITTIADIPSSGSGLGSSSSLTVGLLNALYHYIGISKNNEELAEEACDIEINILKNPIGKQDQYAASFGGLKVYHFLKNNKVEIERIGLTQSQIMQIDAHLMLVYTNVTRDANVILADQNKKTKSNSNIDYLHDLAAMPILLKQKLENGDIDSIGHFLKKNWELKKQLASGIEIKEITDLITIGEKNGALGAKILGAGGGGFVLFYIPLEKKEKFKQEISNSGFKLFPIKLERYGTRIILNSGRSAYMV
jgi:D-glycero-alpha-D-manno-heptose-7-phosphate kinase